MYQHSDKNMQYQFTLRQRVSAASRPSSGLYRTHKSYSKMSTQWEMGSHCVLILLCFLYVLYRPDDGRLAAETRCLNVN